MKLLVVAFLGTHPHRLLVDVQALFYIIFGVGLDDSFILFSAYVRTDLSKDSLERIREMMDDVAVSIFMTTVTTEVAFGLGISSSLPAIRWVCVSGTLGTLLRLCFLP